MSQDRQYPRVKDYVWIVPVSATRSQVGTAPSKSVSIGIGVDRLRKILSLLDGQHPIQEITQRVAENEGLDALWLEALVAKLDEVGLLDYGISQDVPPRFERWRSQLNFFSMFTRGGVTALDMQTSLSSKTVGVIGAGGIGCHALCALARAGVKKVVVVDYDTVSLSNLNRQILYGEADVGVPKCKAAVAKLREINPSIEPEGRCIKVLSESDARRAVEGTDFVLCTADFPFTEVYRWVNLACVRLGIPWMPASLGETIGTLGPLVAPRQTACFECMEQHIRRHNSSHDFQVQAFLQSEEGTESAYHDRSATLGACVGVIGNLAAWEAIRFLTGLAQPVTAGRLLNINLLSMASRFEDVPRLSECPVCARR